MKGQQELPLRQDAATRFTPWIVTLMVYLSTISLIISLGVFQFSRTWDQHLDSQFTVEVPSQGLDAENSLKARVLDFLNRTPDIKQVKVLSTSEVQKILSHWLGSTATFTDVPLPLLIDVERQPGKVLDMEYIRKMLSAISPNIVVTDHQEWQHKVIRLVHSTALIALLIVTLIIAATLLTTAFTTRTSLLIHRNVIEVLHLVGASHEYIARQFQKNALRQGLIAGSIGSLLMLGTYGLMVFLFNDLDISFIGNMTLLTYVIIIALLAPLVTSLLMIMATRWTVLRALNE